ncbi:hypothetical protein [Verminephrobacter eiseniae]
MPANHPILHLAGASLLAATLASGCATATAPIAPITQDAADGTTPGTEAPQFIPVACYGRYTLVELTPDAAQRNLLLQLIEVSIPDTLRASVADALRWVRYRCAARLAVAGCPPPARPARVARRAAGLGRAGLEPAGR